MEGKDLEALPRAPPRGPGPPWIPVLFKGGKGVGLSLCRLSAFCHAESLIPAVRFFRKEKSSLLRVGYFLRRTGLSAQTTLETFCVAAPAPYAGLNFFFTKKWVGGRSALREVSARQAPSPKKIYGNPRGFNPLGESARAELSRPCPSSFRAESVPWGCGSDSPVRRRSAGPCPQSARRICLPDRRRAPRS